MCTLPTLHASPVHAVASRRGRPRCRWSSSQWHQELQTTPWAPTVVTWNWSYCGHLFGYFRRQVTVFEIVIAELHCLSNGGHRVDCSVSYVCDSGGCTKWDRRDGLNKNRNCLACSGSRTKKMFRNRTELTLFLVGTVSETVSVRSLLNDIFCESPFFCSVTSCVVAWYNYLTYLPQNLLKCFLVVQLICGCTQTWIMIGRRKVTSFLKLLRIFCCTFKKASPTRICMRSKMHMKMGNYLLVLPFVCLYVLCIISCFFLSLLMNNRSFLKVCCKFWPTISLQKGRLNFANVLIWFENLCMETVCVHIF